LGLRIDSADPICLHARPPFATSKSARSVFDRYNIVSERDLGEAGGKLAAYVEHQPATPTAVPLRAGRPRGHPHEEWAKYWENRWRSTGRVCSVST
jgi:hypothetical protein